MALTTYTELKASVADWLNRTDLTAVIPDAITLAESEMKRRLRRSSTRTTLTISGEATSPPADMAELRSISFESGSPYSDYPIEVGTAEMLAERRAWGGATTGRPMIAAYLAGKIVVSPSPDQSFTARIVYFTQLTALSGAQATNAILTEAPDAYLFGALTHMEPYLEHDERAAMWRARFDAAIEELNNVRDREEHSASLRPIRLPVVF